MVADGRSQKTEHRRASETEIDSIERVGVVYQRLMQFAAERDAHVRVGQPVLVGGREALREAHREEQPGLLGVVAREGAQRRRAENLERAIKSRRDPPPTTTEGHVT